MKILTRGALREEHRQAGLYLEEDDHLLYLMRGQKVLERFSVTRVGIEAVHKVADKYMSDYRTKKQRDDLRAMKEASRVKG